MKKSSKILTTIIIILLLAIIGGAFFFIKNKQDYDTKIGNLENQIKTFENAKSNPTNNVIEENNDIVGYYHVKDIYYAYVYLYEDGTFNWSYCTEIASGFIGNYVINDNELVLNKLFTTGSDASLYATNGNIKMKINSDGTLTYNNIDTTNFSTSELNKTTYDKLKNTNTLTFEKTDDKTSKEYLNNSQSINRMIQKYYLGNDLNDEDPNNDMND